MTFNKQRKQSIITTRKLIEKLINSHSKKIEIITNTVFGKRGMRGKGGE